MSNIWYLSPSNQPANLGINGYGTEKDQMNLLLDEIIPHLDRAGVSFHRADRDLSIQDRCRESNAMKAGFHLALHSNAGGGGTACGPVAMYYSETGRIFGQNLVTELLALGQKNNRSRNVKEAKWLYELRKTVCPSCLLEVDFHDSPSGVDFLTKRRAEIAEVIARVIIETDGKSFVPPTPGEHIELCKKWGLFDAPGGNYRWSEKITREEAASIAVRLKELILKEITR